MASGAIVSGLDRLVEAVEATEAAARRQHGFPCPHPGCPRVFSKRYNQQAHMRLHDGSRPFRCPRCPKDFMWKSSLKSHAKMHDKLDAAANAHPSAHPQLQQQQPHKNNAKTPNNRVAKRRAKTSSPARKLPRNAQGKHHPDSKHAQPSASAAQQLPSPMPGKASAATRPVGRQSPDCVTRMDLETATLLTMFR